jgi:hypothetical protein
MPENHRETGARKYPSRTGPDPSDNFSQDAAANEPPNGTGDSEPGEDAGEKARQNPKRATPSPATEKVSGAGPATAEHSKDAKAPKEGRQPGAYVKD